MSKRRYKITITDIEALAKAFPQAVDTIEIPPVPARTERKANYTMIANLLDCKLVVPGIEVEQEAPPFLHNKRKEGN